MIFSTLFLAPPSAWQIAIVVLVILLLFGGRKIPELMRGLGSGIKEFKDATKEEDPKKNNNDSDNKSDTPS